MNKPERVNENVNLKEFNLRSLVVNWVIVDDLTYALIEAGLPVCVEAKNEQMILEFKSAVANTFMNVEYVTKEEAEQFGVVIMLRKTISEEICVGRIQSKICNYADLVDYDWPTETYTGREWFSKGDESYLKEHISEDAYARLCELKRTYYKRLVSIEVKE